MKRKNRRAAVIVLLILCLITGTFSAFLPLLARGRQERRQDEILAQIEERQEAETKPLREAALPEKKEGDIFPAETMRQEAALQEEPEQAGQDEPEGAWQESEQKKQAGRESAWQEAAEEHREQITEDTEVTEEQEEAPDASGEMEGIGILTIPKIEARLPVVAGVLAEQLKSAEGWLVQSAPVGDKGNAVIAGHRSYTYGRHFNRLEELEAGDEIGYVSAEGEAMRFLVIEILVTAPEDAAVFAQPEDEGACLTLYTCTPVRVASHRLIVRAKRVEE